MIVKNEINIHPKSVDYINETLGAYTETYHLSHNIKNPIIHIYPVEDTYSESGDLNGYIDALFFKMDVYDPKNGTVYKGTKYHDGIIPYKSLNIAQIKIFKDLSTMINLTGNYNISDTFAAVDINPIN